jgi:heme-degrading monooxygenase HmoA
MVVTIFRSRLREGIDLAALEALGMRMYELASSMPGFVSYKDFAAADGESVALVEFEDEASVLAWRKHAEHVQAQRRGREEFFAEFRITVCTPLRDYTFQFGR